MSRGYSISLDDVKRGLLRKSYIVNRGAYIMILYIHNVIQLFRCKSISVLFILL